MSATMTREEREQFLAGAHVGVLSVASESGGGPLAVPVWYSYQPGGPVNVITGPGTRKAAAIRAASTPHCFTFLPHPVKAIPPVRWPPRFMTRSKS